MLFGDPVQVKDSILSIPIPQSLQVGAGGTWTQLQVIILGATCEAFVFVLVAPVIYISICIIYLILLLKYPVSFCKKKLILPLKKLNIYVRIHEPDFRASQLFNSYLVHVFKTLFITYTINGLVITLIVATTVPQAWH